MTQFDVVVDDITKFQADAIVNAANKKLLGGGGVDGAIHKAAGSRLYNICLRLGGSKTGEAKITPAFNIKTADYIIHTPGPVFLKSDSYISDKLLAECYLNSLRLAEEHFCHTIAFPSISTGAFHFPLERAAEVVAATFYAYRKSGGKLKRVTMCCFDLLTQAAYKKAFAEKGL